MNKLKINIILNFCSHFCLIIINFSPLFLMKLKVFWLENQFSLSISLASQVVPSLKGCFGYLKDSLNPWKCQVTWPLLLYMKLTEEEGPLLWCPANMYICLSPITEADDPDMGGGVSPLVSMCFLQTISPINSTHQEILALSK